MPGEMSRVQRRPVVQSAFQLVVFVCAVYFCLVLAYLLVHPGTESPMPVTARSYHDLDIPAPPKDTADLVKEVVKNEIERQQMIMHIVLDGGEVVGSAATGFHIVTTSRSNVLFPEKLKDKHPATWSANERLWANITFYPWPDDIDCRHLHTSFANVLVGEVLTPVGLASYPGSGNTWLRFLIQGATGYFTGSMYNDLPLSKGGFYGEGVSYNSGMTLTVKSHGFTSSYKCLELPREEQKACNHMDELNRRAILLIRNPFDALISHRHLEAGAGHTGIADQSLFGGQSWKEYVDININAWKDFYLDWLSETEDSDILVTCYENVKDDLMTELIPILDFLKIEMDFERLSCVGGNSEGYFHRNTSRKPDPFDASQKSAMRAAIDEVSDTLVATGRRPLPVQKYNLY